MLYTLKMTSGSVLYRLISILLLTFSLSFCSTWPKPDNVGHQPQNKEKRQLSNSDDGLEDVSIEPRIIGGTNAVWRDLPFLVRVEIDNDIICGGVLLDHCGFRFFVTAAHCLVHPTLNVSGVQLYPVEKVKIIAADTNYNTFELPEQWFEIVEMKLHDDYDPRFLLNDIALIRVDRYVHESTGLEHINLPDTNWEDPEFCTIGGWGSRYWGGPTVPDLQIGEVPVLEWHKCRKLRSHGWEFLGPKEFCCTNHDTQRHGVCQGDSGGPCAAYNFTLNTWYLAGTVCYSVDKVCGNPRSASVFTRVTNYVDWIKGLAQGWLERYGTGDPKNNETNCVY